MTLEIDKELKFRPRLELLSTAFNQEQLLSVDTNNLAQIAIVGRSNVGKSSLINALAGRRKLAKISSTPGKTRSVNFYKAFISKNDPDKSEFILVDLPGYGHASRSKGEREAWGKLITSYLQDNNELKALLLLLDARLSPQRIDIEMLNFARSLPIKIIPILTKSDKCTQRDLARIQNEWAVLLDGYQAHASSAKTYRAIDKLWELIRSAIPETQNTLHEQNSIGDNNVELS